MKMLTFFAFSGLINWLIILLEPICRTWNYIKPVNAKKSQDFHFLNPRKVFSALILGNWENPPLPSDIKPPLKKPQILVWTAYTTKEKLRAVLVFILCLICFCCLLSESCSKRTLCCCCCCCSWCCWVSWVFLTVTGEGGKILTPPCGDDECSVPVLFLNSSLKI